MTLVGLLAQAIGMPLVSNETPANTTLSARDCPKPYPAGVNACSLPNWKGDCLYTPVDQRRPTECFPLRTPGFGSLGPDQYIRTEFWLTADCSGASATIQVWPGSADTKGMFGKATTIYYKVSALRNPSSGPVVDACNGRELSS